MNRLSKFRAKTKEFELPDGEKIVINGLNFPELAEFGTMMEKGEFVKALNYMLYITLRKAYPNEKDDPEKGISDEELKEEAEKMEGNLAMKIVQTVQEVSNIPGADNDPKKKELLEKLNNVNTQNHSPKESKKESVSQA